jgi:hypothetical protein
MPCTGCFFRVPVYGGPPDNEYDSQCQSCCVGGTVLNWYYSGGCQESEASKQAKAAGPLAVSAYAWARGCDGSYSVVEITFAGYVSGGT